jgi:hypothetical protein
MGIGEYSIKVFLKIRYRDKLPVLNPPVQISKQEWQRKEKNE